MSRFAQWTLNQKLAAVAATLGFIALFGSPSTGSVARVDTRELSTVVEKKVDHVTARELAGWIIEGRADYRLVDLRQDDDYASYHVPTAEHVPLPALLDYGLQRNEKVVLYSDGGIHSAQAWFLMKAQGYRAVYMLLGGLDAWRDEVLFPALPEGASAEETAQFEQARRVSAFFGGRPRTGVADAATPAQVEMPQVEMPTAPQPVTRTKQRREGC